MAKKGQNFNKYNDEFRNKVVDDYFSNLGGVKSLAKKYNISYRKITIDLLIWCGFTS